MNPKLVNNLEKLLNITRTQAIMLALAMNHVQNCDDFIADYGRFGKSEIADLATDIGSRNL